MTNPKPSPTPLFDYDEDLLALLLAEPHNFSLARITPACRLILDWLKSRHPFTTDQLINASIFSFACVASSSPLAALEILKTSVPTAFNIEDTIAFLQEPTPPWPDADLPVPAPPCPPY